MDTLLDRSPGKTICPFSADKGYRIDLSGKGKNFGYGIEKGLLHIFSQE
jgi:hypothetical protein